VQSDNSDGWQPLRGLKVIDFSMLLPGPLTTLILADLGAEVIKVEPPGGDYARHMKGYLFEGVNRNKSSIVVDLKAPEAQQIVERLASYGDIAIEGFRPGVADRLGIGAQQLQAINPELVYCSLSGFGQTGPMRSKAGHDLAYIAMGGGLVHKGQLRRPPSRSALPVADIAGGSYAAIAILAAMHARTPGDPGTVLDLSLYEAVLYSSAIRFGFDLPADSVDHLYPGNDLFTCGDGKLLALTIVEVKFWDNFVRATKTLEPAFGAEDFATGDSRLKNAERLMSLLDDMFATKTGAEWVALFDAADVPATVCVSTRDAIATEHAVARAMHVEADHGTVMPFPVIANGLHMPSKQTGAPPIGADGVGILDKLGFTSDEIASFGGQSVVQLPSSD